MGTGIRLVIVLSLLAVVTAQVRSQDADHPPGPAARPLIRDLTSSVGLDLVWLHAEPVCDYP